MVNNGVAGGFFKSFRGVRLTLFAIVAEHLGKGLHKFVQDCPTFAYNSSGGVIPYLSFADDTLIFTHLS